MRPYFLFLIFFAIIGNSQSKGFIVPSDSSYDSKIEQYFNNVSTAELLIIKGYYREAFLLYEKAFLLNSFPLLADIENLLQLTIILNDNEAYQKFNSLKNTYIVDTCINQSEEKKILSRVFFRGLLSEDQNDRSEQYKLKGYAIYEGESGKFLHFKDSLRHDSFMKFYEKYGFPSEFDVGIHGSITPRQLIEVLFSHWKAMGFDIDRVIIDAARKGKIHPVSAARIIGDDSFGLLLAFHNKEGENINHYLERTIKECKIYDDNRKNIYLDNCFNQVLKYEFQTNYETAFSFPIYYGSFVILD